MSVHPRRRCRCNLVADVGTTWSQVGRTWSQMLVEDSHKHSCALIDFPQKTHRCARTRLQEAERQADKSLGTAAPQPESHALSTTVAPRASFTPSDASPIVKSHVLALVAVGMIRPCEDARGPCHRVRSLCGTRRVASLFYPAPTAPSLRVEQPLLRLPSTALSHGFSRQRRQTPRLHELLANLASLLLKAW